MSNNLKSQPDDSKNMVLNTSCDTNTSSTTHQQLLQGEETKHHISATTNILTSSPISTTPLNPRCCAEDDTLVVDEQEVLPTSCSLPSPPSSPHPSSLHPPPPENIIIFDWDDTLLASTFLSSEGFRLDSVNEEFPAETLTQLKLLEHSVILLLNRALEIGHTCIITNAEHGWVQLSAQKFIPGVMPTLRKMNIVSARSTYECHFPEAPNQWKLRAFSEQIKDFADMKKNVISFGDSQAERQAVRAVTKELSNTTTKSIKFVERPSIQQLQRQLEVVTEHFHFICGSQEDLDLMLTLTQ